MLCFLINLRAMILVVKVSRSFHGKKDAISVRLIIPTDVSADLLEPVRKTKKYGTIDLKWIPARVSHAEHTTIDTDLSRINRTRKTHSGFHESWKM